MTSTSVKSKDITNYHYFCKISVLPELLIPLSMLGPGRPSLAA
jgi:hypothetical protein